MRTALATLTALITVLASGCDPTCDDEPPPELDAAVMEDADEPVDSPADACVCEPHWPTCPAGCVPPDA